MGTVHANSAEETIVRVTSPPMDVPSIMLSGLDLIIVEHRYYDRKKGTIRRISEIAELYGALDGKPKTQTIFQRDAAHDAVERTIIDSKYLKTLSTFTGLSREQIEAELQIRKQFLEKLITRNIRSLSEVAEEARKFLLEKRTVGDM
jgi:flagellar protein FlaI